MPTSHRNTPMALLLALSLGLAGLALTPGCVTVEGEPAPRFVITRTADQVTWLSSLAQTLRVDEVRVDPLGFASSTGRLEQLTTQARIEEVRRGFAAAMQRALTPRYPLASEGGAGVLVVEISVTDQVTEARLVGHAAGIGGSSAGQLPALGIQAHFWDGGSGELVATLVSLRDSAQITYALSDAGGQDAAAAAFLPMATRLRDAIDRSWDWNDAMASSR